MFWAKIIAYGLIIASLLAAVHFYNEKMRDEGRAEISGQWAQATLVQKELFDKRVKDLETARAVLSKQYHAEKAVREDVQRRSDKEREDAIRSSAVAGNVCFDERMRDNWNRDSGVAAGSTSR